MISSEPALEEHPARGEMNGEPRIFCETRAITRTEASASTRHVPMKTESSAVFFDPSQSSRLVRTLFCPTTDESGLDPDAIPR